MARKIKRMDPTKMPGRVLKKYEKAWDSMTWGWTPARGKRRYKHKR